jgi:nucleotide-binding universal stress UspA family protein
MRDYATKFDRVMLLTDLTEKSHAALGYARAIAEYYNSHLIILHVRPVEKPVSPSAGFSAAHDHGAAIVRDHLEAIGKALRADGISVEVRLCRGTVARQTILRNIRATKPDLIVQGTGGITDLRRPIVGSIAEGVFRSTETPVLTVPAGLKLPKSPSLRFQRILLATDFGTNFRSTAVYALSLAQEFGARAYLCHVVPPDAKNRISEAEIMASFQDELQRLVAPSAKDWCEPRCVVEIGKATEAILKLADAEKCDLIVLGAHGLGRLGTRGKPGTVFRVVAGAKCPVLTILSAKREQARAGVQELELIRV